MLVTFAGVDLPYHSTDLLNHAMNGHTGRYGQPERKLFNTNYAYRIKLHSCLPGYGSITTAFSPDVPGTIVQEGSFFISGAIRNKIIKSVDKTNGLGKLVLTDGEVVLNLGNQLISKQQLVKDGLNEDERVWLLSFVNGSNVWRNQTAYNAIISAPRDLIRSEYIVDEPESWALTTRFNAAHDFNQITKTFVEIGLRLVPRLELSGGVYQYGTPRTVSVDSANRLLDSNLKKHGHKIIFGSILESELKGAELNRQPSIACSWINVNSLGTTQTTGTSTVNLTDVYPEITPWPAYQIATLSGFTASAVGATAAAAIATARCRSWYRWLATIFRLQGGQPGFYGRSIYEQINNQVTFAGLIPWELTGTEGEVSYYTGAGDGGCYDQPCTVLHSLFFTTNYRNTSVFEFLNAPITAGTITGTAPVGMSSATITRNSTGNAVSVNRSGSSYTLTGVPDGEYTVTRVGTATPTSQVVTVTNASTAVANFT